MASLSYAIYTNPYERSTPSWTPVGETLTYSDTITIAHATDLDTNGDYITIMSGCVGNRIASTLQTTVVAYNDTHIADTTQTFEGNIAYDNALNQGGRICRFTTPPTSPGPLTIKRNSQATIGTNYSVCYNLFWAWTINLNSFQSTDDWRYDSSAPASTATTYEDGAKVVLPASAGDEDWLFFAHMHVSCNNTTDEDFMQFAVNGTANVNTEIVEEAEDVDETPGRINWFVYENAASSASVTVEIKTAAGGTVIDRVKLFGIRLDAFESHSVVFSTDSQTVNALNTAYTVGTHLHVAQNADKHMLFYGSRYALSNTSADRSRFWGAVRVNNSAVAQMSGTIGGWAQNYVDGDWGPSWLDVVPTTTLNVSDSASVVFGFTESGDISGAPNAGGNNFSILFNTTLAEAAVGGPVTVNPGVGEVTVVGYAPTLTHEQLIVKTVNPGAGEVTLVGYAATLTTEETIEVTVNPGAGEVTLVGYAPTITSEETIEPTLNPGAGEITVQGYAPTVTWEQVLPLKGLEPAQGTITIVGHAPSVATGGEVLKNLTPGSGLITVNGYAPTVTWEQVYPLKGLEPAQGTITINGYAPTALTGSQIFKTVSPGAGAITVNGYAPTITTAREPVMQPGAGQISIIGYKAAVFASVGEIAKTLNPGAGILSVQGYAPRISTSGGWNEAQPCSTGDWSATAGGTVVWEETGTC